MEPVSSTYQVFINHRGPDVKRTLASLIYHRLTTCHGLRVFKDDEELRTGDTIEPAIRGAIESASTHIAIFSGRYAESVWCLNELDWILRSHHERHTRIIPVFYDVQPSNLRQTESGPYAEAFENHRLRGRDTGKWETALKEASQISGVLFTTNNSDHGKKLEKIAEDVLKEVCKCEPLEVATYPVGLEQAVEEFQLEIKKHHELNGTMIVWITGMAGLGKSTLARRLCNLKRPDFSRFCFLSEVRESKDKLTSLQQKLLRDLLGDCRHFDDTSQGKSILRDRLRGLRVLIVLDDVDRIEQINSLLDIDAVGAGSLILITSCNKNLLGRASRKTRPVLYEVKPLDIKHAGELFCFNAFSQPKPKEGFESLVTEFLKICDGLPYSLIVLGAQLRGTPDIMQWRRQLKKFSRTPHGDIKDKLMVCYEALNNEEKEMFMDIGCFFEGEDRQLALRVLEGLREGLDDDDAWDCLESLRQKCLLEYRDDVQSYQEIESGREEPIGNYDNLYLPPPKGRCKITMHNQVVQLARDIARQEFRRLPIAKPLRLSCSNDILDIQKMLQLQLQGAADSCTIRGIRKDQKLPSDCAIKIKGVGISLFVVEVPIDLSSFFGLWDMEGALVWLRLRNVLSVYFPDTISLGRLRVLEFQGHHGDLVQLLDKFIDPPSELREMNINVTDTLPSTSSSYRPFHHKHTETKFADNAQQDETTSNTSIFHFLKGIGMTSIKWLQKVELKNITSLSSLPFDFSELVNLRHLDLSGCTNLIQLPKSFSKLTHLQFLALRDCKNLSIPTDILGEISTLEHVDFKGCVRLVKLPRAMAYQRSLRYLNLLRTHLSQLPTNLELNMLEQLRIGSPQLTEFPPSLGDLWRLEELILIECRGLKRLSPEEIAGPNIKVLVIGGSPLTNFIFQDLGTMDVGMPILRDFTLKDTSISEICIPDGVYPSLETVDLSRNFLLRKVNGLPSGLVRLNLQNCEELDTLNLSNMVGLKFLDISKCPMLKTLNVEAVTSLEEIKAVACWKLKRLQGLSQGGLLNCLHISTDKGVIWTDICKFLTFPPLKNISTAIFSGRADDKDQMYDERALRCILNETFELKIVDIVSDATRPRCHVKIENFHSHCSAILMCFITSTVSSRPFRVRFDASNYGGPVRDYTTLRGNGSGKSLDVFIWKEDSDLFEEYKDCSNVDIYCSELCGSEWNGEQGERGWIVKVDKNTDAAKVCNEFIKAFAYKDTLCLPTLMEEGILN